MAALLAAPSVFAVVRYLMPKPEKITRVEIGKLSDLAAKGKVLQLKVGRIDAAVVDPGDGSLIALNLKCTHLGCTVKWSPETNNFRCPCHGGEYSANGTVTRRPPPRPLERLQLDVGDDGTVVVADVPFRPSHS
jgi:cytochrome b6-f complex iron-sulfur subunit